MTVAHLDYETRSRQDLKVAGAHRYAIDPSFEILMASVSRDGEDRVHLWVNPKFRTAEMPGENAEAERILAEADVIYAHNAPFEQACSWGAEQQDKVRPLERDDLSKWRCTAAMARKAGLPYSLEKLAGALGLPVQKDARGKKLIKFFCEPREDGRFNDPKDFPAEWREFGDYCITDNRVERLAHQRLKLFELQGISLDTFQFDLRMNQRGIPINVEAARHAQKIIDEVQAGAGGEFRRLTGLNPTQREKVKDWLAARGLDLPNMQAETVEKEIQTAHGDSLRALQLYQSLSYAAVKKIQTMLDCVCPDKRVRGAHLYYGAGTGRWSGKLLQPQNFKKTPVEMKDLTDPVYNAIWRGTGASGVDAIYGSPLEMLSICIRHFIHLPGTEMLDGDYNAVEARIVCWLAGEDGALREYRGGMDRYQRMASEIYDQPLQVIEALGKDSTERLVGKQAVLGCGFGLGRAAKFQETVLKQGGVQISKELAEKCIKAYRRKHPKVVSYWYQMGDLCMNAVRHPGQTFGPFVVRRIGGIPFLLLKLRSGRSLAYPHPAIELCKVVIDEEDGLEPTVTWRENVTYWGQLPMSAQWGRIKLYGGKIVENETQATAADLMAYGALTAESRGMEPFMLVHDQGLAMRRNNLTADDYSNALGAIPPWAKGLPLKVEAKVVPYYRK